MKFRKKPVVIEALPFDGCYSSARKILDWMHAGWTDKRQPMFKPGNRDEPNVMRIPTLEGDMTAQPGDWIIKGVKGEFYPCKPDIFAATYEPVPVMDS